MLTIKTYPVDLELKETFRISHTERKFQPSLIVEVSDGKFTGYGEAAATSYYGVHVAQMASLIDKAVPIVRACSDCCPEEIWIRTAPIFNGNTFAQCALDMALHDFHGKKIGKPLYELWGLQIDRSMISSYTIGIDTVEKMVSKMLDFPWPLYKVKLGTREDVRIIQELRRHSTATFRVDANGGWNKDEAVRNSALLKPLKVELIEQPLPREQHVEMQEVIKRSVLPVIADESCVKEEDVKDCEGRFDGINIKLSKCGGITPALRMISNARKKGLKIMGGCMTESTVGISAVAQMSPLLDYLDIDGSLLIKNDIAEGVWLKEGKLHFPPTHGTGVSLLTDLKNRL